MDRVVPIREAVLSTIEHSAPPHLSYVFTNTLQESDDSRGLYERVRRIAAARGSRFLPVLVTCDPEEQLRRAANADRAARLKIADPGWVRRYMETTRTLEPDDPQLLRLDTTSLDPEAAAETIVSRL